MWLATGVTYPLARVMSKFDQGVVDGVVNGISSVSLFGGSRIRRIQSGVVSNYATLLTLGLVLWLAAFGITGGSSRVGRRAPARDPAGNRPRVLSPDRYAGKLAAAVSAVPALAHQHVRVYLTQTAARATAAVARRSRVGSAEARRTPHAG